MYGISNFLTFAIKFRPDVGKYIRYTIHGAYGVSQVFHPCWWISPLLTRATSSPENCSLFFVGGGWWHGRDHGRITWILWKVMSNFGWSLVQHHGTWDFFKHIFRWWFQIFKHYLFLTPFWRNVPIWPAYFWDRLKPSTRHLPVWFCGGCFVEIATFPWSSRKPEASDFIVGI